MTPSWQRSGELSSRADRRPAAQRQNTIHVPAYGTYGCLRQGDAAAFEAPNGVSHDLASDERGRRDDDGAPNPQRREQRSPAAAVSHLCPVTSVTPSNTRVAHARERSRRRYFMRRALSARFTLFCHRIGGNDDRNTRDWGAE